MTAPGNVKVGLGDYMDGHLTAIGSFKGGYEGCGPSRGFCGFGHSGRGNLYGPYN